MSVSLHTQTFYKDNGNVSTEDFLYMLHGMNIETGIDLPAMVKAGRFISSVLGKPTNSQVLS